MKMLAFDATFLPDCKDHCSGDHAVFNLEGKEVGGDGDGDVSVESTAVINV